MKKNSFSLFKRGETPLRIEFIPYNDGDVSMDDDVIKSPETLLIVEVTFCDSRKALGLTKKDFEGIKRRDSANIIPAGMYFSKLIQECVEDLKNKNQMPDEKTLSKYSEDFVNIVDDAIDRFLKLEIA